MTSGRTSPMSAERELCDPPQSGVASSDAVREMVLEWMKEALPWLREECLSGLRDDLRAEVEAVLANAGEPSPLRDDHAWSVAEVSYFLGVSESEVRKLEREGKLPALPRYCNRLLFDPVTVRAFREGRLNVTPLKPKTR